MGDAFWVIKIWKQKLVQMGATVEKKLSNKVTHVLAMDLEALPQQVTCFNGVSFNSLSPTIFHCDAVILFLLQFYSCVVV